MELTIQAALVAIDAALQASYGRKAPSAIAVVDAGGNLLAFAAHEDAILAARGLAIGKAYTALSLKAETAALGDSVLPGGPFYGLNNALPHQPLVTFAGGLPLAFDEGANVVGGVGVSGGTLDDDIAISAAARDALNRITAPRRDDE